jgi:hypothetical protein
MVTTLIIALALTLHTTTAIAVDSYRFETISVPGSSCTSASKINARKQIVGGYFRRRK